MAHRHSLSHHGLSARDRGRGYGRLPLRLTINLARARTKEIRHVNIANLKL